MMTPAEKSALQKIVSGAHPTALAVFSVTETDAKSAASALDDAKALIAKRKGDYALVVLRK